MLLLKHLIMQMLCQGMINYYLFITSKCEKKLNNTLYLWDGNFNNTTIPLQHSGSVSIVVWMLNIRSMWHVAK